MVAEGLESLNWIKSKEVSLRFRIGSTAGVAIEVEESRQLFPHLLDLLFAIHVLRAVQILRSIL